MFKLNLISPEQKKQLEIKQLSLSGENILGLIVLAWLVFGIFLLPLKQKISVLKDNNLSAKTKSEQMNAEQSSQFSAFNQNLNNLYQIGPSGQNFSKLLASLSTLTPENIGILELTATGETKDVIIKGFALTRNDLISFQNNLNGASAFENIESPLENYLEQAKINFEIKAKLKQ